MSTSREHRIYLAIWRKAGKMDSELTIHLSSFSEALSMRLGMYRAMQPYRTGEAIDPELAAIAESHSIFVATGSKDLIIRRKVGLEIAESMLDLLGIDEEDLITLEEREARDRLQNLMTDDAPDPFKEANPFFSERDR